MCVNGENVEDIGELGDVKDVRIRRLWQLLGRFALWRQLRGV